MAPSGPRDEEDVDDPAEAADDGPQEDEFDGFSVDDEDLPFDDTTEYDGGDDAFVEADALPDPADAEDDTDDGDDDVAPLLAADDDLAEVVAAVDDDEPDEDDTVRDGEFVCRSCFMAKRDSALADEDAMLCRDCL